MTDTSSPLADAEQYFPPKPGGAVDTARKQAAAAQAAVPDVYVPVKVPPVTVRLREPDLFAAKTVTVTAGASALAMPADPDRKRGVLNLVTASAQVTVARDRASADNGTGYVMESANPPLELGHRREVWLHNSGSSSVQVSVLTESYERE